MKEVFLKTVNMSISAGWMILAVLSMITSLISKDEAQAYEIDELVEKKFEGSLPAFLAAFTKRRNMTETELDEIQDMINRIRKGGS